MEVVKTRQNLNDIVYAKHSFNCRNVKSSLAPKTYKYHFSGCNKHYEKSIKRATNFASVAVNL